MATTRAAADMVLPTSSAPPLTPRRSASLRPREALSNVLHSWISRQFLFGCAILFPIAVTVFVMIAVFRFFEDFFSPLYRAIGLPFFGLGFMTSMAFIFLVGLLGSSWAGAAALSVSEWIIKRLPLARHVYSAAKQVSTALKPTDGAGGAGSFRECVLVRHPRRDELMIGFVTGSTRLRAADGTATDMVGVFVPTNHLYVGDFVLVRAGDVVRTEMSVRDGIEAVVSVGMSLPKALTDLTPQAVAGGRA